MACNQAGNRIWLETASNPQDAVFAIDDERVESGQCYVLNRLPVNASNLNNPVVKLDFSCIVSFDAEDEQGREHEVEVDLLFKLIRNHNGCGECLKTFRYLFEIDVENSIDEIEVEISESFAFSYVDRPCPKCCEYLVVVEGRDFEGEFEHLRVTSPTLSAIIQG